MELIGIPQPAIAGRSVRHATDVVTKESTRSVQIAVEDMIHQEE